MSHNFKFWKVTALLLIGFVSFLYIIISTVSDIYYLISTPVAGIVYKIDRQTGYNEVVEVIRKGPAEQAGLQPGDLIVAFNGKPLNPEYDFGKAMEKVKIGTPVVLTILRDHSLFKISLATGRRLYVYSRAIFFSLLPGVFFSYALFIIGVFVLFKKIEDRTAHVFFLLVIFWALAMWHSFPFTSHNWPESLAWLNTLMILISWPLAVSLLLHFTLIFPFEKPLLKKNPILVLSLVYLPVLTGIPFYYAKTHGISWADEFLSYSWGILFTILFTASMNSLGYAVKKAPDAHTRTQAIFMLWGTNFTLLLPTGIYFLPRLFLGKGLPYSEYILLLVVFWPLVLAYVIVKHRFMDIDVIIKRGVAYALMSGFVVAAYFLLVVGIGKLFLYFTGSTSQIVTIIATLLIAALFNPVKNRIREFVDRSFYPSRFTYRKAIHNFSHQLVRVVDLEKWLKLIRTFFTKTMTIYPVYLYWWMPEERKFKLLRLTDEASLNAPAFSRQDQVVKLLEEKQHYVDVSPLHEIPNFLSEDELHKWAKLKAEIVIPLIYKGQLRGFISLGPKAEDEPYFTEDLELIETLSDQINISLENALLTEELREQARLKKELEVARQIQLSTLPQSDPRVPGLQISGISIPAFEVGGDYYDYIDFGEDRLGIVVGDVSGKGTSAALYMSQLKGILKTACRYHQSLKSLVVEVNAITYQSIDMKSFITLSCALFDLKKKNLRLVRAGHLPLIYYSAKDQSCHELIPKGIGIGLENGKIFNKELEEIQLKFHPGDVFLFYTDGIVEVHENFSSSNEYEISWLEYLLKTHAQESAAEIRTRIIDQVKRFTDGEYQKDDMTLVVVKVE